MDIKQEKQIKFWEWCGFEIEKLRYIDGSFHYLREPLLWLALPLCLDTIYQYAIPKLQDKGYIITLTAFECSGFSANIFNIFDNRALSEESFLKEPTEIKADSPTESLFNAIMKVIENEGKVNET